MSSRPSAGTAIDVAQVEIDAPDPGGSARFYAETLGLATCRDPDGGWRITVGTTTLRVRQAAPDSVPSYHLAFAVPENAIEAARDWLLHRGVAPIPVEGDPVVDFPAWNAHALYFHDPAGNILELIARHDLTNAADGPFGSESLHRVDEVGLPTTDLPALVATLETRLGALPYGSGSATFQAVGDARGLAIVVAAGRGWFPTGGPAALSPLSLVLRGSADATFALPGGPYAVTVRAR